MLTADLTVSHLYCSQRYFTSALVRPASDEEKTCESVTHSCTHDRRGQTWLAEEERVCWVTEWMTARGKLVFGYFFEELEYISFKWNGCLSPGCFLTRCCSCVPRKEITSDNEVLSLVLIHPLRVFLIWCLQQSYLYDSNTSSYSEI